MEQPQQPSTPTTAPYEKLVAAEDSYAQELQARNEEFQLIQESMSSYKLSRAWMVAISSTVIFLTSGGLILGFGPIYSLLVEENQWKEKCTPEELAEGTQKTCAEQEVYLQYVYSTAFLCLSIAMAFFGLFLDFAGPRLNVLFGLTVSTIGNLLFAFGDSKSGNGLSIITGYALIAIGGYATYTSSFQFAKLFEEKQGLVISFISGFFNASGYVYMLLMMGSISRELFFTVYAGLMVVCLVFCYFVYPLRSLSKPAATYTLSGFAWRTPKFVKPQGLWPKVQQQFKRADLWYFGIYFGWISTIFAFTGGAIANIIFTVAGEDQGELAESYVEYAFPIIINSAVIFTPIVGIAIDKWGFRPVFLGTLIVVHLFLGSLLVKSLHFQIVSLFLFALAQASFYSLQFAYIVMCFPGEVYGCLQAFLAVCSFSMGLLNYAFTPWVQNGLDGDYLPVLAIMAGPVLVFYFFLGVIKTGLDHKPTTAAEKA